MALHKINGVGLGKRVYLPNVVLKGECAMPFCNGSAELDLGENYLSYPTTGEALRVDIWCEVCGERAATYNVVLNLAADILELEE
jgi:hypothetical protein